MRAMNPNLYTLYVPTFPPSPQSISLCPYAHVPLMWTTEMPALANHISSIWSLGSPHPSTSMEPGTKSPRKPTCVEARPTSSARVGVGPRVGVGRLVALLVEAGTLLSRFTRGQHPCAHRILMPHSRRGCSYAQPWYLSILP